MDKSKIISSMLKSNSNCPLKWTSCTESCDTGHQKRMRKCTGEPEECDTDGIDPENLHFELGLINFEHRVCNTHMCPPKRLMVTQAPPSTVSQVLNRSVSKFFKRSQVRVTRVRGYGNIHGTIVAHHKFHHCAPKLALAKSTVHANFVILSVQLNRAT